MGIIAMTLQVEPTGVLEALERLVRHSERPFTPEKRDENRDEHGNHGDAHGHDERENWQQRKASDEVPSRQGCKDRGQKESGNALQAFHKIRGRPSSEDWPHKGCIGSRWKEHEAGESLRRW